jgi:hypothetical protein
MPRVGFEPTIPAFERAKPVHALDRAVTVFGGVLYRSRLKSVVRTPAVIPGTRDFRMPGLRSGKCSIMAVVAGLDVSAAVIGNITVFCVVTAV